MVRVAVLASRESLVEEECALCLFQGVVRYHCFGERFLAIMYASPLVFPCMIRESTGRAGTPDNTPELADGPFFLGQALLGSGIFTRSSCKEL